MEAEGKGAGLLHSFDTRAYLTGVSCSLIFDLCSDNLVPLSFESTEGFLIRGSFSTLQAIVFSENSTPLSSNSGRATILAKCSSAVSYRVKLLVLAEVHLVIFPKSTEVDARLECLDLSRILRLLS